jgi:hypothetical protein
LIQHLRLQKEHIVSSNPSRFSSEKMAAHLGIRYYKRRNGSNIPLIPADQLPFYIEGLSCPLSDLQIAMQNWLLVGETNYPPLPLQVFPRQLVQQANSGFVPFPEKRKYCKYWIEHGTCGYGEGCRHIHEMPDRAKLGHLGFADYPEWHKIENPQLYGVKPAKKVAPTKKKINTNKKTPIEKDGPIEKDRPIEKEAPVKKGRPTQKKHSKTRGASGKKTSTTNSRGASNRSGALRSHSHAAPKLSSPATEDPPSSPGVSPKPSSSATPCSSSTASHTANSVTGTALSVNLIDL